MRILPLPYACKTWTGVLDVAKINLNIENYNDTLAKLNASVNIQSDLLIDGVNHDEGYILTVNENGISINATSQKGVLYAYFTLSQLIFNYEYQVPYCEIKDYPRCDYRGFMLDVGRYFMPIEQIKKLINLCALHKINKFRLHLTEDQGWRMEIKKYPLLTLKGSIRQATNFCPKKHSGFYTQAQLKELVAYCKKLNIELIPEIDMPGHTQSAIACYPFLSCFDRKLPVAYHWGVKHDILCAGKESTYEFIKNVLDEVCSVFESEYIHIGGDEAPKTRWRLCPHCQKLMKEKGLQNEEQLQSYFTNRVAEYLHSKGKKVIMWNEWEPTGQTQKDVIWQVWSYNDKNKESMTNELDNGRHYINSYSMNAYLDLPERTVPLKACYDFDPVLSVRNDNFVGVETCLWSEYIPNYKKAVKWTLPRLCALSEVMWSNSKKDYSEFLKRLDKHTLYLLKYGYNTANYSNSITNKTRQFFAWLWFNRRPLHWHGLHNAIDNAKVAKHAKKLNKQRQKTSAKD